MIITPEICLCYRIDKWVNITDDTARDLWSEFEVMHQVSGDKFPYTIKDCAGEHEVTIHDIHEEDKEVWVEYSYTENSNKIPLRINKFVNFNDLALTIFKNKHCYGIVENRKTFCYEPNIEYMEDEEFDHIISHYLTE